MANERIKISQLTPKGANLASTDLLEISEFDGSGYVTRSITGQEIIDGSGGVAWGDITGVITDQTDLQTELDGKFDVPTGDTTQYLDGAGTPTTFPAFASADKMVTVGRNSTGSTLYKGTIVYISGSTGNRPNFVKAKANSEATSAGTFGVIEADIPNNSDGNCVTIGTIDNLDTRTSATHPFTIDTLADGDTIYLSPLVAGYITNVKPSAPYHLVYIGKVVRTSPTNGTIVYRIQNGYELDEIHDVAITSPTDGQILTYDSTSSLWVNETPSSSGVTDVTGSDPIVSTGGSTPDISIRQSGSADDGYLSTGDWNMFNNKQDALSSGVNIKTINYTTLLTSGNMNLVAGLSGNSPINTSILTGGIGSISIDQSNSTTDGYLNSTDWNTFNGKQPTLVSGTNIKTINGSSVLGSGNLTISGGGGLQGVHALGTIPAGLSYGYIASLTSLTATASFNTNTNAIILAPFIPARNITYTSLKINVTTATASCATRILIYSDSSGLPSTKIFESTSVDCSTIGTKTITITGTLTAGTTYWIGTHANNNCILTGIPVGSALVLGSFIMTGAPINAWNYAYGFGSAPTTLNQAQRTNSSGSIQLIQILP
jgi:hypothetical protein